FAQPLGVALAVAEAQRVRCRPRHLDQLEDAAVKQDPESRFGADAEMMPATAAHLEICRQLAMKQHLLAGGTFLPQIVRNILARERPDLRQHVIGQPVVHSGSQTIVLSPATAQRPGGGSGSYPKPSFSYRRIAGVLSRRTESQTWRRASRAAA